MPTDYTPAQRAATQRLVDEAYAHIQKTRNPSVTPMFNCSYAGIGCAFSPAIKPQFRNNAELDGLVATLVIREFPTMLEDWAKEVIDKHAQRIQGCHDRYSHLKGEAFVRAFNEALEEFCTYFGYTYPGETNE